MNRSEIDQKFLDEITESRYPRMADERPPLRIDIAGVGAPPSMPEDVGPAPDDIATQMAAGTEPEGATPMTLGEFATTVADAPAGVLKGVVQGTVGLPGDIISLVRGVYDLGASGGSLDAFLAGLGKPTGLPTTEDVKKFFDTTLGIPLVPEGASDRRREAVKTAEFVGELGGAGRTAIAGTKAAVRGARDIVQEMATTPPRGSVQIRSAAVQAPRSGLGFYSVVEETVANLPQAKGTGQQFLAQIQKTSGVKPDEIKWTGLDEFLKGKKSVTKTEIQEYLNANRVDVQEVRLSDEIDPEKVRMFMADEAGGGFNYDEAGGGFTYDEAVDYLRDGDSVTKFSKNTLPGGENYREILLTLPAKKLTEAEARIVLGAAPDAKLSSADIAYASRKNVDEYRSGHFDQPNILAHMRVNDRTVDGKKTLFIEEIQSDWHQAGRKKGYRSEIDPNENALLVQQYDSLNAERKQIEGIVATGDDASPVTQNAIQNLNQINAELGRVSDRLSEIRTAAREGVPDAPFKTSWHELTLKRAIQEASEKGYDQIAFTTGKTQAERYDLSKQVDSLLYSKNPDGTYRVSAQVQGRGQMMGETIPEADLADYVSKEVAEKMAKGTGKQIQVAGKYDSVSMTSDTKYMTELSGEGLKVGGEGMKGFYDNILPKSLDKLGKKFDAKVGKTQMDGVEVWQMDITPKMRESVTTKGQPLFAVPAAAAAGAATMQQPEERM